MTGGQICATATTNSIFGFSDTKKAESYFAAKFQAQEYSKLISRIGWVGERMHLNQQIQRCNRSSKKNFFYSILK